MCVFHVCVVVSSCGGQNLLAVFFFFFLPTRSKCPYTPICLYLYIFYFNELTIVSLKPKVGAVIFVGPYG